MQTTKSRDRREYKVSVASGTVEYSVISSSHNDFYYGIFTDISAVGMCLLTTSPLLLLWCWLTLFRDAEVDSLQEVVPIQIDGGATRL